MADGFSVSLHFSRIGLRGVRIIKGSSLVRNTIAVLPSFKCHIYATKAMTTWHYYKKYICINTTYPTLNHYHAFEGFKHFNSLLRTIMHMLIMHKSTLSYSSANFDWGILRWKEISPQYWTRNKKWKEYLKFLCRLMGNNSYYLSRLFLTNERYVDICIWAVLCSVQMLWVWFFLNSDFIL